VFSHCLEDFGQSSIRMHGVAQPNSTESWSLEFLNDKGCRRGCKDGADASQLVKRGTAVSATLCSQETLSMRAAEGW